MAVTNKFNTFSTDPAIRSFLTILRGNKIPGYQRRSELPSVVSTLIKSGKDVKTIFALVCDCFNGVGDKFGLDSKLVSIFARNGISPDTRVVYNGMECSMLQAMTHGSTPAALEKYMTENSFSIDSVDQFGRTALGVAAMLGHDSWPFKCMLLLNAGFNPLLTSKAMKKSTIADKIVLRMKSAELTQGQRIRLRNTLGRSLAKQAGWLAISGDKPEWLKESVAKASSGKNISKPTTIVEGSKVKLLCLESKKWCSGVVKKAGGGMCVVEYRFGTNDYRTRKISINSSDIKLIDYSEIEKKSTCKLTKKCSIKLTKKSSIKLSKKSVAKESKPEPEYSES